MLPPGLIVDMLELGRKEEEDDGCADDIGNDSP